MRWQTINTIFLAKEFVVKNNMRVDICICTYNRIDLLKEVLLSLNNISMINKTKVIVIDNNSSDDTLLSVEKLKLNTEIKYDLDVFVEKKQGLSHARNRGIAESTADYLVFLDDDAFPDKEWLVSLYGAINKYPNAVGFGGRIDPLFVDGKAPNWFSNKISYLYSVCDLGSKEFRYKGSIYPIGANMVMRRSTLLKHEFDPNLGRVGSSLISGEETVLFNAIYSEGGEVYYLPNMRVKHFIHPERLSKKWIYARCFAQGQTLYRVIQSKRTYYYQVFKWTVKSFLYFSQYIKGLKDADMVAFRSYLYLLGGLLNLGKVSP